MCVKIKLINTNLYSENEKLNKSNLPQTEIAYLYILIETFITMWLLFNLSSTSKNNK